MKNWKDFLNQEQQLPYFEKLMEKVDTARSESNVYPSKDEIFSCFDLCPYEDIKVVIIGQDPYHGAGQAHGLSFSVKPGQKIPPSLKNIYKELKTDLDIDAPNHGYLADWAKQGVLMMNTSWSVEEGKASSHKSFGWDTFTKHVLEVLNNYDKPLVFILWGNHAQAVAKGVTNPKHHLIKGIHPSPLAGGGFFGSKPFSQTNLFLEKVGRGAIDWRIENDSSEETPKTKKTPKTTAVKQEKTKAQKLAKTILPLPENQVATIEIPTKVKVSDQLYKINTKGKWGLVDEADTEIVKPIYDRIFPERNGFIRVRKDGLIGLLDNTGKTIQPPKYIHISTLVHPSLKCGFTIFSDKGCGWMNEKGEEIIPPLFIKYSVFNDKFYKVETLKNRHSLYSKEGKETLEPIYFSNIYELNDGFIKAKENYKTGYALLSPEGKRLTDFKYGDIYKAYEGFFPVLCNEKYVEIAQGTQASNSNKKWNFLDTSGKEISTENFEDRNEFHEGLAAVILNGKLGFINTSGKLVIPCEYEVIASFFKNGLSRVYKDGKIGIIDRNNNVVIPFEYDSIGTFSNELTQFMINNDNDSVVGYVDKNNTRYTAKLNEPNKQWNYYSEDSKPMPDTYRAYMRPLIEDSLSFRWNDKCGFKDSTGKIFIDAIYEKVSSCFWGGIGFAMKNGKWGFINKKGDAITDFCFENAGFIMQGYCLGKQDDGLMQLITLDGIISDKAYKFIGYSHNPYIKEIGKRRQSPGGDWKWNLYFERWELQDIIDKDVILENNDDFSLLTEDNKYAVPYFELPYLEDARVQYNLNSEGKPCFPEHLIDNPLILEPGVKSSFSRTPNTLIAKAKIRGTKSKVNPNYNNATDPYYLNDYQSKVYDYVEGCQNRFYVMLAGAISEWILWRLEETLSPYINFETAFQKVDAIYAASTLSGVANAHKLKQSSYEFEDLVNTKYQLTEIESDDLAVFEALNNMIADIWDYYYAKNHIVSHVVFARLIFSGAKKKAFNEWLDMVLEKGKAAFPATTNIRGLAEPYRRYYDMATDDMVPREFFFDETYQYTPESGTVLMQQFLDNLNYEENPYLLIKQ